MKKKIRESWAMELVKSKSAGMTEWKTGQNGGEKNGIKEGKSQSG